VSRAIVTELECLHQARLHWTYAPLTRVTAALAKSPEQREAVRLAVARLTDADVVVAQGERLRLSSHTPQWSAQLARLRDSVLSGLKQAGLASPSVAELARAGGAVEAACLDVLEALVEAGEVVALAPGLFATREVVGRAREQVVAFLQQHGKLGVGDARDLLSVSRKYLLPLLEMLDRAGVTQRRGDVRVMGASTARPADA
jgi:selenocysteine-specific elongation factor